MLTSCTANEERLAVTTPFISAYLIDIKYRLAIVKFFVRKSNRYTAPSFRIIQLGSNSLLEILDGLSGLDTSEASTDTIVGINFFDIQEVPEISFFGCLPI
jgi:hypothetical protein